MLTKTPIHDPDPINVILKHIHSVMNSIKSTRMRSVTQYTKSSFMYLVSGDAGHLTINVLFRTVPEEKKSPVALKTKTNSESNAITSGCYATRRHRYAIERKHSIINLRNYHPAHARNALFD